MSAKHFTSKEKLFKILKEFQARFNSPFRLAEATRWCESYFIREGGNVETVGVFLEFIMNLGFVYQVDQNVFFSRYYFNVERIEEFFSTFCRSIDGKSMEGLSQPKSADESGIRSISNSQEDVFENNCCCKSVLANAKSHLWFEEIIRRLSCVMETDRNELISMMESSDTDSSTPSLPQKPNDFLIDIGTAAYTNSIALENWHNCLKNSTGELVSHVAITCLDALSKWPNNVGHQSKVCERKCLPNSFLSITTSHLKNFKHYCIPKTVELLLDYIFSSCPDAKLLATMNNLLKGWINSVSSNANDLKLFEKIYSPNVISSHGSDKNNLQNISLPPLTTPLRDTNNLHKKVYGHSLSKAFTPSDDNLFTEYHPISPIIHCQRFHVRVSDPGHNCENLSGMLIQTRKSRSHSVSESSHHELNYLNGYITANHQRDSGKSSNERNLPTTSYTQHWDHGAYCLSNRTPSDPISSIQHHWPIMESYNLALACQLVLLFLPPVMYSRLKIMVDLLRRVLSNHERLALWLVNHDSRENIENKSENILPSNTLSSLEITLHVIVKHFGSLLLRVSSDSAVKNTVNKTTSRIRWRECLLCLLLCDPENFLLTLPNGLQSCLRSVNNNNTTSDNIKTEQENILHIEELIGLDGFKSQGSRKSQLACSSSSPEHVSLPAFTSLIKSASSTSLQSRLLKLTRSRDSLIKFASTPTKSGRSSSLQNSPRSTDTFSCRRIFDESNLDIGNLSIKSHSTLFISEESCDRFGRSGNWSVENSLPGSHSSIFFQSDLDPKRLAALGNTAHLIKLLNQILNDREMNPRRKMKCLQDFRKSHPDVFWLRFGNEEKASNYLSRLQRRIDSQTQPSVFERITNALRRRLQSPVKQQD